MNTNFSPKCEYGNHQKIKDIYYYCYACQKVICQNCLDNAHKVKKEFVKHKYEILNDIIIKIISKKKTIELELSKSYNNILNSIIKKV